MEKNFRDLLIRLNLIIDLVIDSDFCPEKRYRKMWSDDFNGVRVYIDEHSLWMGFTKGVIETHYCSLGYDDISISFYPDRIISIEITNIKKWGKNLFKWAEEVHQRIDEGIRAKIERKIQDIEEARATGN